MVSGGPFTYDSHQSLGSLYRVLNAGRMKRGCLWHRIYTLERKNGKIVVPQFVVSRSKNHWTERTELGYILHFHTD